ncbi:cylicin-2-like [Macrobrachium rosenbergii]|uniref:cylicin-2-like n=1 Tax=Macrobrachium rosenbergii TaxID=79674 RepID=UPI0034D4E737
MGAGSAKGRPTHNDDEQDKLSATSSDKWANNSDDEFPEGHHTSTSASQDTQHSPNTFDPGPSSSRSSSSSSRNSGGSNKHINEMGNEAEDAHPADQKGKGGKGGGGGGGGEHKRRFGFHFGRHHNDAAAEKPADHDGDAHHQQEEADKKKKEEKKEERKDSKKDGEKRTGFKLFGWRSKKGEERDNELDKDIDDLEKTFDSLGIVGKNMWGEEKAPSPRKEAADDLELLEPMRKRKNVRVRGTRATNGMVATENGDSNAGKNSNASSGSRRTFRYSWETEKKKTKPDDEDEWEYKAVVIEGFDIDKFRKANKKDPVYDSASLPNAVSGDDYEDGKPMLMYDQNEQQILASIERDFTFN